MGAAALGAVVWGIIGTFFDYEFAFVAWGIGIGVGLSSYILGSRGVANAVVRISGPNVDRGRQIASVSNDYP